ncbi:DNA cytosine methyltransferase [Sphaerisporangium siamense]|uniref:DNA (cytosine-5-)-methyltransferase n=1 Tax=Sphaerisporangium siamense TaxID=795645 RepID=A0A7W7D210_9ACTN|nr:DNA (cytosine-5-)-methyltransferase [Sphaerisporangium siamense]MBB4698772.1 DNA (cytosine-5)-methyltransferase 1 [Sphaerisporangium siamense]GII89110.1 DNA cytosine methyltransferase [Sphaerisporangium siamense]
MTEQPLRVIEICAGAGGQALGLEQAGFEHELAVELDQNAVNTLRHNRPQWKVVQGDVADLSVWDPADYAPGPGRFPIDLLAGGVPCPPFTIAGKQLGATDERDLFAWAVEQARTMKPRALLLENVRGLSMPRFAGYRQHVLDRLQELGYAAEWRLLQASHFGVAQLRPRFVLVAMEPADFAYFHWPEPAGEAPTVGETLLPLMSINGWRGAEEWAEKANDIAPTIVGGSKKHGGADLGPTRAKRAWADLGVDALGIANHAPNPDDEFLVGPKLTCEMVARLQGWDDNEFKWIFTGKKTSNYRQIGNAFPPPVAKAIGIAIRAALNRTTDRREHDLDTAHDPIYRALRDNGDFMTAAQIIRATKLALEPHELERRIALLSRDFYINICNGKAATAYKLGQFKAFLGQEDHVRHEQFNQHRTKIS